MNKRRNDISNIRKSSIRDVHHNIGPSPITPGGWVRPYGGYSAPTQSVVSSYTGNDKWTSALTQSVVDVRASFLGGEGLQLSIRQDAVSAEDELEYIQNVLEYNNILDFFDSLCIQIELEGELLCVLTNDKEGNIKLNFLPQTQYHYTVEPEENDLRVIKQIKYKDENGKEITIKGEDLIYRRFGPSTWWTLNQPATSRIASSLPILEHIGRATDDLRQINHLYSHPTPYFQAIDRDEAQSLAEHLKATKWTIGNALVSTAEMNYVSVSPGAINSLKEEIDMLVERLSGMTGVPIYFLGLAKQLHNRSTAQLLLESLESAVKKERNTLLDWFNELFNKILLKSNALYGSSYTPNVIIADIPRPAILEADERVLTKLIDLHSKGVISTSTLLRYVPEIEDPDEELRRLGADKLLADEPLPVNPEDDSDA